MITQRCIHFIPGGNWNPMQGRYWDKWYVFCILDPFHHDNGGTEVWICVLGLCSHQLEASALCSRGAACWPWATGRSYLPRQEERTGDGHGSDLFHGSVFHSVSMFCFFFFFPHKTCELPDSLNALLDHPEGPLGPGSLCSGLCETHTHHARHRQKQADVVCVGTEGEGQQGLQGVASMGWKEA